MVTMVSAPVVDGKKSWFPVKIFPTKPMALTFYQWPFQEPKVEVPTIYKAYVSPKFQGISPQTMAQNMVQYCTSIFGSWRSPIDLKNWDGNGKNHGFPIFDGKNIRVRVSSRIWGWLTPHRRTDFLARTSFDFDERLLLTTPSFSTEQLLETSESRDPDFLGSLSAQNPGA